MAEEHDAEVPCFDQAVLAGFERARAAGGVLAHDPSGISFKTLDGPSGFVASFHAEHFAKKRTDSVGTPEDIPVTQDYNPAALSARFNFTKVKRSEVLFDLGSGSICAPRAAAAEAGECEWANPVMVNLSPLSIGHVVFPVCCAALWPQVLTAELVRAGLRLCALSGRADFRAMFNSRGAFASVNHFHFHGLYLEFCGMAHHGHRLPIETAPRAAVAEGEHVRIESVQPPYPLRALVVSGPAGASEEVARSAWELVKACQDRAIPHNLVFRPCFADGALASLEVLVVPRRQQRHHDVQLSGYNAAVLEVCGCIVAQSQERFDTLTEEELGAWMGKGVALPDEEFAELARAAASGCGAGG